MARHLDQALHRIRLADRHHHDTADLQLRQQGAGRVFGGGCHDNAIKGRNIRQAKAAVRCHCHHIDQPKLAKELLSLADQPLVTVYRVDPARQLAKNGRLIARPGAHLEHGVARLHRQRLRHQPHDRGLADRLPTGDGQWHVFIGPLGKKAAHELAAVDPLHRGQHTGVGDAFGPKGKQKAHLAFSGRPVIVRQAVVHHANRASSSRSLSWAVRSQRRGVTEM